MKVLVNRSHEEFEISDKFKSCFGTAPFPSFDRSNPTIIFLVEKYGTKDFFSRGDGELITIPDGVDWRLLTSPGRPDILLYVNPKTQRIEEV